MWHTVLDHVYGAAVQRSARQVKSDEARVKNLRYHNIEIFISTTKRSAVNKIVSFRSISWERGKEQFLFL